MLAIRAFHAPNLIVFQHKQHGNTQKPYRCFLHLIVLPGFVIVQHNVRDSYIPQAREYCQYLICSKGRLKEKGSEICFGEGGDCARFVAPS